MESNEIGKTQHIRQRLLEASNEEELNNIREELESEPGVNPNTVKSEVSKLKKKGLLKFGQMALANIGKGSLDELVHGLVVPDVVDGRREAFNAGVEWATRSILTGIRLSQELSSLGIAQAGPLIKMAQQMNPDAGQIARETGLAMGGEIAGKMFDVMQQKETQKPDIAQAPDPFKGLMARTMETMMNRMTGMLFGAQGGDQVPPTPGMVDKRGQKQGQ